MKKLKFIKEYTNRWYVVLPEWTGAKEDLEMVAGADTMLDIISEGNKEVTISISEKEFEGSDKLEFVRMATEINNGAFYKINTYKGVELNLELWLCNVTLFVLGDFPKQIYISKVETT